MTGRARIAVAALLVAVGLTALVAGALALGGGMMPGADPDKVLAGRMGGRVETLEARLRNERATQVETGPLRRIFQVGETRVLLDVTPEGRVRQLTLGHNRQANETWQPDPVDWSLEAARTLARTWLPPDATFERREPFVFRDVPAGTRDVYRSPAVAKVFPAAIYAAYNTLGPPGVCAVTYYQTSSGGVAFFLVGIV